MPAEITAVANEPIKIQIKTADDWKIKQKQKQKQNELMNKSKIQSWRSKFNEKI